MSSGRAAAKTLLFAAFCLGSVACADERSGDESQEVSDLLRGDGSDFDEGASDVGDQAPVLALQAGDATAASLDTNGPHKVASYTQGFPRGKDHGPVTVYYPTDRTDPLPGVVMCPGYTAKQSSIAAWGPFFASHGIVLVTMDTVTTGDQVPQRARGLTQAIASLKLEGKRAGSPLNGKMSQDLYGLSGWSMGGGGTWIATTADATLKSAVTLAGHNLTGGGAGISRGSKVPTLMMNGADDTTLLGGMGQSSGAYDAIPATTPKLLYEMSGEGHFSWGTPRTNGNASGRYMMAWQKTYLEGDASFKPILLVKGPKAAAWKTNLTP